MLEDGSILRLGEGEVVEFALYAGKELTDQEAEALPPPSAGALREKRCPC